MTDTGSEQNDPRLVQVYDAHRLRKEGTVLHRWDEEYRCSHAPVSNVSTDLTTAAVLDGRTLCSRCEWPEGAEEVLQS